MNNTIQAMSTFWKARIPALLKAIEATGTSRSQIATAGGLSAETLKRAIDGQRVIDAKANGIVKGLKTHGVADAQKESLFQPA
jgi:DNA-binding phage protein